MRIPRFYAPGIVATMLAIGCQPGPPVNKTASPDDRHVIEAEPIKKDPQQRALAAKDALFKRLSTRLLEAMGTGGPEAAIEVCSREATKIAAHVSEEYEVKIGRTSFKLRNAQNAPPEWVKPFVESRITEAQFVELPEQHTGAIFPITLKVQCLFCHGPNNQIAQDVRVQLAKLYPNDQATGFHEGDLRGWFWVDVPDRPVSTDSK